MIYPELMSVTTLIRCPMVITLLHFSMRALEAVLYYWRDKLGILFEFSMLRCLSDDQTAD